MDNVIQFPGKKPAEPVVPIPTMDADMKQMLAFLVERACKQAEDLDTLGQTLGQIANNLTVLVGLMRQNAEFNKKDQRK